jgi:WD40 repeat protein
VIHDLETGDQKVTNVKDPRDCAVTQYIVVITTFGNGLHLLSTDGVLVHIVPDSTRADCVAFHPRNTNILAIGCEDGAMRIWDVYAQELVFSFEPHANGITSIRFAPDCRLFLSSWDKTASIVTLDDQFHTVSSVKLKGHTRCVNDILALHSSDMCITCSNDDSVKVWDCGTGTCLRTLTEHRGDVMSLVMHPNGQCFASGSYDHSVIIWSCETFEVLYRIRVPYRVDSLVFHENHTLYVGVCEHGVISMKALTGEAGPVIIQGTGSVRSISFSKTPLCSPQTTPLTHTRNSTVPAPKPWTSSTHALWPLPAQHIVHKAVVVLWKVRDQGRLMQVPYELVEIILRHV